MKIKEGDIYIEIENGVRWEVIAVSKIRQSVILDDPYDSSHPSSFGFDTFKECFKKEVYDGKD